MAVFLGPTNIRSYAKHKLRYKDRKKGPNQTSVGQLAGRNKKEIKQASESSRGGEFTVI